MLTVWPRDNMAIDEAWDNVEDRARWTPDPNYRRRPQPKILGTYIGYSMYMSGPVLVKSRRSTSTTEEARQNVGLFNFRGNKFKLEPGGQSMGSRTIPHFAFTIPARGIPGVEWDELQPVAVAKSRGSSTENELILFLEIFTLEFSRKILFVFCLDWRYIPHFEEQGDVRVPRKRHGYLDCP